MDYLVDNYEFYYYHTMENSMIGRCAANRAKIRYTFIIIYLVDVSHGPVMF